MYDETRAGDARAVVDVRFVRVDLREVLGIIRAPD
jgi:hypothetical protein